YTAYRIPATFISAAAYGTMMAQSIPWLVGRWADVQESFAEKALMVAALLAAAIGVFLCASRIPVVLLVTMGLIVAYRFRTRLGYFVPVLLVGVAVAYLVQSNERLQRFASLQDADLVAGRIRGSANLSVIELLLSYPMGAGLGSAFGTSI